MMEQTIRRRLFFKYLVERFISLIALIVLSPLMLLIALTIKLTSPGPIFYVSDRLGLGGKVYRILKFRSLHQNVPEKITTGLKVIVEKRDSRLTPIGAFLRIGFDELPQLINIVRGEMTLIGIRPDPPWMLDKYLPYQRARLSVLPGISSLAVVCDSRQLPVEEGYAIDYWYINHFNFLLDLKIAILTFLYMAGWKNVGQGVKNRILGEYAGLLKEGPIKHISDD